MNKMFASLYANAPKPEEKRRSKNSTDDDGEILAVAPLEGQASLVLFVSFGEACLGFIRSADHARKLGERVNGSVAKLRIRDCLSLTTDAGGKALAALLPKAAEWNKAHGK